MATTSPTTGVVARGSSAIATQPFFTLIKQNMITELRRHQLPATEVIAASDFLQVTVENLAGPVSADQQENTCKIISHKVQELAIAHIFRNGIPEAMEINFHITPQKEEDSFFFSCVKSFFKGSSAFAGGWVLYAHPIPASIALGTFIIYAIASNQKKTEKG